MGDFEPGYVVSQIAFLLPLLVGEVWLFVCVNEVGDKHDGCPDILRGSNLVVESAFAPLDEDKEGPALLK